MNWGLWRPILFLLTSLSCPRPLTTIDPFTAGVGVGLGLVSTAAYAGWDRLKCQFQECCREPWIINNVTKFEEDFKKHVFGQHLVLQIVSRSLRAHFRKVSPSKALVFSFHGWTGGGKNYVAKFVAESLFKEGLSSRFVHLFLATLDFPDVENVDEYKLNLQDWIRGNVTQCDRTVFIFDEMDKMPEGLIDAIKPFIDHHESIGGVDYRKAIFIFLSNTGGKRITQKAYEFWESGKDRKELSYSDFENLINEGAFNEKGGLRHSTVIEKSLIDHYVPFLPLERMHVRQCVKALSEKRYLTDKDIDSVVDKMTFWPEGVEIYSKTGCKRVAQKVDILLEEMYDDL